MIRKSYALPALAFLLAGPATGAEPARRLDALFAAVTAGARAPIDCLSPALLLAIEAPGGTPADRFLVPPVLPESRVWTDAAGIRVHYTLESGSVHAIPGAGPADPPRAIERIGEALLAAVDLLAGLGFRVSERHPWIDVYVAQTPEGISGYVAPGRIPAGSYQEDRPGFLVLSNRLVDASVAAAHQLAHLTLLGYSSREPVWWHEATAAWVASRSPAYGSTDLASLAARLARPEDGLDTDDPRRLRGNLLLPAFLSLGEDPPTSVRAIWELCAAFSGDNTLEAIDRVARESGRGSLADLLRAYYSSWVTETAGRSRLAGALGIVLPEPRAGAAVDSYPAAGAPEGLPIAPLGASFLWLQSAARSGGLALRLQGVGRWAPLLLVRSSEGAPYLPVPLPLDEEGRSAIRYPWAEVSDAVALVVAAADGEPLAPTFSAVARPDIPFDLLAFQADLAPEGVLIRWSTDSEADLFGWNIYRGARPDRVDERINRVPVPAAGGDRSPASYSFVDSDAPVRKLYYRLEAVTIHGLRAGTHRVGAPRPSSR